VVKGDVKKKCRPYTGFADRIIMPLPWSSLDFLDEALLVAKRRAVVHIYLFGKTDSVLSEAWKKIREHAKRNLYTAKKTGTRIVRTYSPTESEIVIDYTISKNKKARIPSSP
jgi:tRNA G37 N-methylase Trm5